MNLPNRLTMLRLVLAGVFVLCMSFDFAGHYACALVVFVVATITDYLDGAIARARNLITDFGKLMDPLADKILIASAFICLIPLPNGHGLPVAAVILVIAREFLITGLRLLASSQGKVLPAEKLGKHKTGWQMGIIIFYLLLLTAHEYLPTTFSAFIWDFICPAVTWFVVALTVYSGAAYFAKNCDLIQTK